MYVYGITEEVFTSDKYDTREEALEAAKKEYSGSHVLYTGKAHEPKKAGDYFWGISSVVENMQDAAYEDAGCEDWLDDIDVEGSLEEFIRHAINDWADQCDDHPKFFKVDEIETHKMEVTDDTDKDST